MNINAKYYTSYSLLTIVVQTEENECINGLEIYGDNGNFLGKVVQSKVDKLGRFQGFVKKEYLKKRMIWVGYAGSELGHSIEWVTEYVNIDNFDTNLMICKPFLPSTMTDKINCNFYFVSPEYVDIISVKELCRAYKNVYIEKSIAAILYKIEPNFKENIIVFEDCVQEFKRGEAMRVAFLASSDTHVDFMLKLADKIPNHLFLIPAIHCKDDAAAEALERAGKKYIEIDYKATECEELLDFNPYYIYSATDWTSEFLAVKRIIKNTSIRTVALQEGPEDWHLKFYQRGVLKILNHYRNADIFFAQGSRTMLFIRPQYFSVTGNPKIDRIEQHDLPSKPRVLINCNFTYLNTKPAYESRRKIWMDSVLKICREVGVDYIISKHPRDDSDWDDEHLVNSNACTIRQQILDCSISISRFSSIPYETLALSRQTIYYNNHLEPMPTFMEDKHGEIKVIIDEEELKRVLIQHMEEYPYKIDKEKQIQYLTKHAGLQDGHGLERVALALNQIAENRWIDTEKLEKQIGANVRLNFGSEKKYLAFYVTPSESSIGEYIALILAEACAAMGHKVFFVINDYSDLYGTFFQLKMHKDIEYILTRDYNDKLENEMVNYLLFFGDAEKERCFYENAKNLAQDKSAEFLNIVNRGNFDESSFKLDVLKEDFYLFEELIKCILLEYKEKFFLETIDEKDLMDIAIKLDYFFVKVM